MNLFPSGIAEGKAFCNRTAERNQLKQYVENIQHTVLVAPRRYGKSSLVNQVMLDDHYCHAWIDFLPVTNKAEAEEKIQLAAQELLLSLAPELKKLKMQTISKVKSLSPELNLSALGQSLTLNLSSNKALSIDETLIELDKYAEKVGKKAVLVLDEFQQISEIREHQSIEALIRHAVERSHAITYVFSGSKRHMLQEMFSQSSRPLYRLCRIMPLDRIEHKEYEKFIQSAAKSRWKNSISEGIIDKIITLTERHPFYLNVLCNELWLSDKAPKSPEQVELIWKNFIIQHKSVIISDIVSLPLNQKKIVRELSYQPEQEPYGAKFIVKSGMAAASIRRVFDALMIKDIIYRDESSYYKVLDPAISYYFKNVPLL